MNFGTIIEYQKENKSLAREQANNPLVRVAKSYSPKSNFAPSGAKWLAKFSLLFYNVSFRKNFTQASVKICSASTHNEM